MKVRWTSSICSFVIATDCTDYADPSNPRNPWLSFSLEIEKMLLAPEPATIASELPILINYPMTRNHDGDPISAICGTDRTLGVFDADTAGEIFIRARFCVRNAEQLFPHTLLKRGTWEHQRHGKYLQ